MVIMEISVLEHLVIKILMMLIMSSLSSLAQGNSFILSTLKIETLYILTP